LEYFQQENIILVLKIILLYYLIIPSFILGSVDNGNCYIGGKMEMKFKIKN